MFLLIQSVSSALQPDIVVHESVADAWQALENRFDKDTPNTDIITLKNILLTNFDTSQNITDHTTSFENIWNRLAARSSTATNDNKFFLHITKLMCESEIFKDAIYMASLMDAYPDLCDTLAARGQQHYSEVRDFFLS